MFHPIAIYKNCSAHCVPPRITTLGTLMRTIWQMLSDHRVQEVHGESVP